MKFPLLILFLPLLLSVLSVRGERALPVITAAVVQTADAAGSACDQFSQKQKPCRRKCLRHRPASPGTQPLSVPLACGQQPLALPVVAEFSLPVAAPRSGPVNYFYIHYWVEPYQAIDPDPPRFA